MHPAVEQLLVVEIGFLLLFAGQFGYAGHSLAGAFALLDFFQDYVGNVGVAVEIVVKFGLDEVADEFCHGRSVGAHVAAAEFGLCLLTVR